MTLILLAAFLTITLSLIAWHLAIYALPVMTAITAFQYVHAAGASFLMSAFAAIGVGLASVVFVLAVLGFAKNPILRLGALALFATPAAIAGYALVHGATKNMVDSGLGLNLLCGASGLIVGIAALANLNGVANSNPSR